MIRLLAIRASRGRVCALGRDSLRISACWKPDLGGDDSGSMPDTAGGTRPHGM